MLNGKYRFTTSSLQVLFGRAFESLALSSLTWGNVPCFLKRRILAVFDFCQGVIELAPGWLGYRHCELNGGCWRLHNTSSAHVDKPRSLVDRSRKRGMLHVAVGHRMVCTRLRWCGRI